MPKFRKKPVVVEAIQFVEQDTHHWGNAPTWLYTALENDVVFVQDRKLNIRTLEGVMTADLGDWIIQGVKGELYPCKPDIFEATYDAA
jgi:hypothetical protein